jgi:pimeloyl-ACP methyl ester carboxylesterase
MSALPLNIVLSLSANVYALRDQSITQFLADDGYLGCEGLFRVSDAKHFSGTTGGYLNPYLSGFGYIAEGEGSRQGEVLVVTRGTATASDWLTDFRAGYCRGARGHMVHIGFQRTWETFAAELRSFIHGKNPTHVHCVGHSLGGALATLNADFFAANRVSAVSLYTLGAPRVGTRSFAESVTNAVGAQNIYRLAHRADPVTMVPIYPFFHTPFNTPQYAIGNSIMPICPLQHKIGQYTANARGASWESIREAPGKIIIGAEIARWLEAVREGGGVTAFSAETLSMIGKALSWILQQALQASGLGVTYGLTALDYLGYMIERGTTLNRELEENLHTVLNAILRFIGQTAVVGASVTLVFARYVLELLFTTLQRMALNAMSSVRRD